MEDENLKSELHIYGDNQYLVINNMDIIEKNVTMNID